MIIGVLSGLKPQGTRASGFRNVSKRRVVLARGQSGSRVMFGIFMKNRKVRRCVHLSGSIHGTQFLWRESVYRCSRGIQGAF